MKKILIISAGVLPVPAKKGGAVETLIDAFIEKNNEQQVFKLDVITCGVGSEPKNGLADYITINYPYAVKLADRLLYFYSEKIKRDWRSMFLRNKYKSAYYQREIGQKVDFSKYDAVIVENNMSLLKMISNELKESFSEKCFYHMHSVLVDNKEMIPYLAACRKILTVSDYVTGELKKTVPEFKDTIIEKVTNGIEFSNTAKKDYCEVRKKLREKYDINEDECVFLYSGRLSMEKGPAELLDAFAEAGLENSVLFFAGSTFSGSNEMNAYSSSINEKAGKLPQKVIFSGYIDHEKMQDFYRMADALVVPSIVGDAAPLTVLEGMACGLPLIASRIGGIPEYAKEYKTVYWAEPGNDFTHNLAGKLKEFYKNDFSTAHSLSVNKKNNSFKFNTTNYFDSFCKAIMK